MNNKISFKGKVIVIGADHHNTLGIIRSLGEVGIRVFAIITTKGKSFVSYSKYLEAFWITDEEECEVIRLLNKEFNNELCKPILIPSSDFAADVIDRNYEQFHDKYYLPSISRKEGGIAKFMNKFEMNVFAQSCGLEVPVFDKIDGRLKLTAAEIEKNRKEKNISYPLVLKPLESILGTKDSISVIHNFEDLERVYQKLEGIDLLIQKYIKKEKEFGLEGYSSPLKGKVVIPGVVEKIRLYKPMVGSTTYGKIVKSNPKINIGPIINLIKALQYDGIFDIDLMVADGKVYFIEMNFRNGAYGYAFTKSGCNIALSWCLSCVSDRQRKTEAVMKEIYLMNEITDFRNVMEHYISFKLWFRQFINAEAKMVYNSHDVKPFIVKLMGGRA